MPIVRMNISRFILLLICLACALPVVSRDVQKPLAPDSSSVQIRPIDKEKAEQLKADPELDYGRGIAAVNLWDRFLRWLNNLISQLITAVGSTNWFGFLIMILVIIGLVYVILRLLRIDALSMFYPGRKEKLLFGKLDEDIHTMDFEALINGALQRKEFRLAIRLLFLQALKLLADRHHIHWRPGKTNHDYLNELQAGELKTGFNELNYYFEYAWYGNFRINEELYRKVDSLYHQWKTSV